MRRALRTKLDRINSGKLSKLEPVGFDINRMRRALPPLQTLAAFEAAARLQSFTLAARELNLTQPAVSQKVKFLEQRLRLKLFRRSNNRIAMTEQGEQFLDVVTRVLNELGEGVQELEADFRRSSLTVSLLPSFASTWFAARIVGFLRNNPSIDLVALSTVARTDFGQEDADVAIRWGPGGTKNVYEERLFGERHIVVASAQLAGRLEGITHIGDLVEFPFLHDTNYSEWRAVVEVNGGDPDAFEHGGYFGDASVTQNAIVAGKGVGVVRDVIAEPLLSSGQLIELPFEAAPGPFSYFFLCPERRMEQPRVRAFLEWLRGEIKSA